MTMDRPKMVACEACGRESALRGKRCLYCGVVLPGAELGEDDQPAYLSRRKGRDEGKDEGPVACGKCGHKVARRMARCIYCGTEVARREGGESRSCPRCDTAMAVAADGWVLVDHCESCKGQFFDSSEFERVRKIDDRESAWFEKHLDPHPHDGEQGKALRCPGCGKGMETFAVGEGEGRVVLDRCPECCGLWLDAGEADALRDLVFQGAMRRESHDFGMAGAPQTRGSAYRRISRDVQMHGTEAERERWRYEKWIHRYGTDEYGRYDRMGGIALGVTILSELLDD